VLKLVIPSGTFTSNYNEGIDPITGEPVDMPLCPDAPGCDFYAGTYFFSVDRSCTSGCCCYEICFDTDDSTGCDCGEAQAASCQGFCLIQICINAPGFIQYADEFDDNYSVTVNFFGGVGTDGAAPPCGACDFRTTGVEPIVFKGDLTTSVPDCTTISSLNCPLAQNAFPGAAGDCLAATGSSVQVSFVS
jgi:hypothetical protein